MQHIPATNPWLAAVEPSPIGETKRWVLGRTFPADRPLVDLSQAVPGYPPALELRRHLGELLLDPTMHGYTPILGLPALRENYAAHLSEFYGASITPAEVGITSGCNQAFCLALIESRQGRRPGDPAASALLQSRHVAAHAGRRAGVARFPPESGAVPAAEDAAKLIGPKTRAIVLIVTQQSDRRRLSARNHPCLLRARPPARHRADPRRDLQGLFAGGRTAARAVRRT